MSKSAPAAWLWCRQLKTQHLCSFIDATQFQIPSNPDVFVSLGSWEEGGDAQHLARSKAPVLNELDDLFLNLFLSPRLINWRLWERKLWHQITPLAIARK